MASKEVSSLSPAEATNFCLSYATLLLVDGGQSVNAENLEKVLQASSNSVDA